MYEFVCLMMYMYYTHIHVHISIYIYLYRDIHTIIHSAGLGYPRTSSFTPPFLPALPACLASVQRRLAPPLFAWPRPAPPRFALALPARPSCPPSPCVGSVAGAFYFLRFWHLLKPPFPFMSCHYLFPLLLNLPVVLYLH